MECESCYNNLHTIMNYNFGKSFSCSDGKLIIVNALNPSSNTLEVNNLIINTLKWTVSKSQIKEELCYKSKIKKEMCPGGSLEKITSTINEIKTQIVTNENEKKALFEVIQHIHNLQQDVLKEYENRSIENLYTFTDLWFDNKFPTTHKGKIKAADDPTDASGLPKSQYKVLEALKSIRLRFEQATQLNLDLTQDIRRLDYGGQYDKTLFILEAMDEPKERWITPEIRLEMQALRLLQQQQINEKLAWVEATCPVLLDGVQKMMVSRRIATTYSPFKNEELKKWKAHLSPEKPKKNIASTSFMIKIPKGNLNNLDVEKLGHLESEIELFAKPYLGEPDCFLSEVGLKYDDVVVEMGTLLPHTIDFAGFQPGSGAIRERVAYTLQEALGIDFGVPPIVILDANFNEFHLDNIATHLYDNNYINEDFNPCHNPFTCFIKFIPDTQPLTDDTESSLSAEEAHKPLINTLLLNADGHLDNCLVKDSKLIMIDFGYSLPKVADSLDEIRQCKNLLIDIAVASQSITPVVREKLIQMDIEHVLNIVRKDVERHQKHFGVRCALHEESYNMLHLNLLLLKIGAELDKTPREIDAVQCPIRRKTDGKMTLHGGEYVGIYSDYILDKSQVDWEEVAQRIRTILNLPLNERSSTDRSYTSLRLRKVES